MQSLICILIPVLTIPALIGRSILRRPNRDSLTRMAGLLTLKPLLTTPIWWLIVFSAPQPTQAGALAGILPGAGLTLLALIVFRDLLFGRGMRLAAWLLIGLDCLRWSNSYLIAMSTAYAYLPQRDTFLGGFSQVSGILGLLLPTAFAVVAWRIASTDSAST